MSQSNISSNFWVDKKVFLTGHTGFKGGWLVVWLHMMGAKVFGYSLSPNISPSLFDVLALSKLCERSKFADIRDLEILQKDMSEIKPDILIHMAAQPLVRASYINPIETFSTNLMGTVNILEAARNVNTIKSIVIVTTDKCYENKEWVWGYRENEELGGYDPYSCSKGCAELAVNAYRRSFFGGVDIGIATVRAGNVIGGGDWSEDRLVPDALKAFSDNKALLIRNPLSTRPWQHVLEPLSGYLMLAQKLYEKPSILSGAWNFGPQDSDVLSVKDVVETMIELWPNSVQWIQDESSNPHEAFALKLDCSKAKKELNWKSKWNIKQSLARTIDWHMAYLSGENLLQKTRNQINEYSLVE